jgi:hypothetical protein
MTRIANPFRYSFKEPYMSVQCIYRCWFGRKYFIWKAKALHQSVNQLSIEIDRRLRLGCAKDDIHYKIVGWIKKARVTLFEVEVLYQSENAADLLIYEQKQLNKCKRDDDCLNNRFLVHVPKWIPSEAEYVFRQAMKPAPKKKAKAGRFTKQVKPAKTRKIARKSARNKAKAR